MRPVLWILGLAIVCPTPVLTAQEVRGRLVSEMDSTPILQALVLLLDSTGGERARTTTSASGGFELGGIPAGRYRVRVQRIGQRGWEAPPFDLAAGQVSQVTLRVPVLPFELVELKALTRRPRCGMTLGDASLGASVLEAAQTALALAEAEADSGRRTYVTESYRLTAPDRGPAEDSVLTRGELAGWPIQSADPDSLRLKGFVHGQWPSPNIMRTGIIVGPTYYAPDARVLFTDWFLESHCIILDTLTQPGGEPALVARFGPAKGTRNAAALNGQLVFERSTLSLRRLSFEFALRPSWAPRHSAGGELRFARLSDGVWLPASWLLRVPLPVHRGDRYRFFGVMEVGGRVTSVRGVDGRPEPEAQAALAEAAR